MRPHADADAYNAARTRTIARLEAHTNVHHAFATERARTRLNVHASACKHMQDIILHTLRNATRVKSPLQAHACASDYRTNRYTHMRTQLHARMCTRTRTRTRIRRQVPMRMPALCTVYCVLFTVYCLLCTVYCALSTV
jgi:hypothetical protein